jgi:flavin reductase (DIM6/NTAB) family NADH-FMN oxidoreductase RutF/rubredoxin
MEEKEMSNKSWKCTVCGYIHVGENPPDICPVCGVDSSFFELVTEEESKVEKPAPVASADIPHGVKPALFKISYGLYIVTSLDGDKINGQCCNTFFQITSDPARVAVGINKSNYTHQFIENSGKVGIGILGQTGHDLVRNFGYRSGRDSNKFEGISYTKGETGVPIITDCIAFLEGQVVDKMDCGTHTLFLIDVLSGDLHSDAEPMTYAYFRQTK